MIKLNVKLLSLVLVIMLPWLNACSINTTHSPQQDQLAADIYAQLALGYMASGHLTLAQQRLNKALQLMPRGELSLKAAQQWQAIQANRP